MELVCFDQSISKANNVLNPKYSFENFANKQLVKIINLGVVISDES